MKPMIQPRLLALVALALIASPPAAAIHAGGCLGTSPLPALDYALECNREVTHQANVAIATAFDLVDDAADGAMGAAQDPGGTVEGRYDYVDYLGFYSYDLLVDWALHEIIDSSNAGMPGFWDQIVGSAFHDYDQIMGLVPPIGPYTIDGEQLGRGAKDFLTPVTDPVNAVYCAYVSQQVLCGHLDGYIRVMRHVPEAHTDEVPPPSNPGGYPGPPLPHAPAYPDPVPPYPL